MFDLFSWSHLLIVLIVALVVVGPKDLPRIMRVAGQWMGKARAMAGEFHKSLDEMTRQSELDELRKEIGSLRAGYRMDGSGGPDDSTHPAPYLMTYEAARAQRAAQSATEAVATGAEPPAQ
ncbi:MAG TPA: Sec-independent protein translocase protein TatB [Rhizomicrobium sp.]